MPMFKCFLSVGFCHHTLNHPSFQDKLAVRHKSGLDTLWVLAGPPITGPVIARRFRGRYWMGQLSNLTLLIKSTRYRRLSKTQIKIFLRKLK
jgi:hypothetical protein